MVKSSYKKPSRKKLKFFDKFSFEFSIYIYERPIKLELMDKFMVTSL